MEPDMLRDAQALIPESEHAATGERRRTALRWMLGAGYAAAAGPVVAQTAIATPASGLLAGEVQYTVAGAQVRAYRAAPEGRSALPVVLVVSEIFGVHEHIADTCRRLAHAGYLALAPDLFQRQGDPRDHADIASLMGQLIARVPDAQVLADLDGAVQWAADHGGDPQRVGITGFCWGGRITWLYAAHGPVQAGVAWYGRLVGQPSALAPRHPVDVAAHLQAPVLGLYGGKDEGIPLETVERMNTALQQGSSAAQASRIVVYPEAPHAFHADYRPSYRPQAAQDGWRRALDWLRQHGV